MTIFLNLSFLSSVLCTFTSNNCHLLPNGDYKFIQYVPSSGAKNKTNIETRVIIADNNFTQYLSNGDSSKGKIEWIYNCTFKFVFDNKSQQTKELGDKLSNSFGDPCFELNEKNGIKISFRTTYSGNLNVTTGEGMIIKIR